MNIQGMQNYTTYDMKLRLSKRRTAKIDTSSSDKVVKKDTYEPAKTDGRKKLLSSIKRKIKSGYYSSDEVTEDLSESFAKIFNSLF